MGGLGNHRTVSGSFLGLVSVALFVDARRVPTIRKGVSGGFRRLHPPYRDRRSDSDSTRNMEDELAEPDSQHLWPDRLVHRQSVDRLFLRAGGRGLFLPHATNMRAGPKPTSADRQCGMAAFGRA